MQSNKPNWELIGKGDQLKGEDWMCIIEAWEELENISSGESVSLPSMEIQWINEMVTVLGALVYYSQIHTVKGVRPVNMTSHEEAWRKGQQLLYSHCKYDEDKDTYVSAINPESALIEDAPKEAVKFTQKDIEYVLSEFICRYAPHHSQIESPAMFVNNSLLNRDK